MPYGAGESTVKDDIIEFVGDSVSYWFCLYIFWIELFFVFNNPLFATFKAS